MIQTMGDSQLLLQVEEKFASNVVRGTVRKYLGHMYGKRKSLESDKPSFSAEKPSLSEKNLVFQKN